MQLSQAPSLIGSNRAAPLLPLLVGLGVSLRRALRSGRPRRHSEWRRMFRQQRAATVLLALALAPIAGWTAFVQFVRF